MLSPYVERSDLKKARARSGGASRSRNLRNRARAPVGAESVVAERRRTFGLDQALPSRVPSRTRFALASDRARGDALRSRGGHQTLSGAHEGPRSLEHGAELSEDGPVPGSMSGSCATHLLCAGRAPSRGLQDLGAKVPQLPGFCSATRPLHELAGRRREDGACPSSADRTRISPPALAAACRGSAPIRP